MDHSRTYSVSTETLLRATYSPWSPEPQVIVPVPVVMPGGTLAAQSTALNRLIEDIMVHDGLDAASIVSFQCRRLFGLGHHLEANLTLSVTIVTAAMGRRVRSRHFFVGPRGGLYSRRTSTGKSAKRQIRGSAHIVATYNSW